MQTGVPQGGVLNPVVFLSNKTAKLICRVLNTKTLKAKVTFETSLLSISLKLISNCIQTRLNDYVVSSVIS